MGIATTASPRSSPSPWFVRTNRNRRNDDDMGNDDVDRRNGSTPSAAKGSGTRRRNSRIVHLRRLPPSLRHYYARTTHHRRLLQQCSATMKASPHVGWFRHAPPSMATSSPAEARACTRHPRRFSLSGTGGTAGGANSVISSSRLLRSSPYVGWFRHAPPSCSSLSARFPAGDMSSMSTSTSTSTRELKASSRNEDDEAAVLFFLNTAHHNHLQHQKMIVIDGRLPGGCPAHDEEDVQDDDDSNDHRHNDDEGGPPPHRYSAPAPAPRQRPRSSSYPPMSFLDRRMSDSILRSTNDSSEGSGVAGGSGAGSSDYHNNVDVAASSSPSNSSSATLDVLSRIANWVVHPLVQDVPSPSPSLSPRSTTPSSISTAADALNSPSPGGGGALGYLFPFLSQYPPVPLLLDDDNEEEADEQSSSCEEEEEDGPFGSPRARSPTAASNYRNRSQFLPSISDGFDGFVLDDSERCPVQESVSSLAEAYHAHRLWLESSPPSSSSSTSSPPLHHHRVSPDALPQDDPHSHSSNHHPNALDYVITQIDIARMVRNANRHLDVESILSLPTITYQRSSSKKKKTKTKNDGTTSTTRADEECVGSASSPPVTLEEADPLEDHNRHDDHRHDGPASTQNTSKEGEENNHLEASASSGGEDEQQEERRIIDFNADDAQNGWSWMMVPSPPPQTNPVLVDTHDAQNETDDHEVRLRQEVVEENAGLACRGPQEEDVEKEEDCRQHHQEEEDDDDDEDDRCVICLEHFQNGDRLRILPCHHLFHTGCIDVWLSGSHSDEECITSGCPTCKKHPTTGTAAAAIVGTTIVAGGGVGSASSSSSSSSIADGDGGLLGSSSVAVGSSSVPPSSPSPPPPPPLDGSVPGWAFAKLGGMLMLSSCEDEEVGAS